MFKIGDFSKLSMVSVKALRYYDELGLLKPEQVDEFTGYRYYAAGQLTRLNRILVLKDLGLSLQQIAQLLDQDLSADQIRGMLRLKQSELQQQVEDGQARLARVDAWLRTFEQEAIMPAYDVVLKKVAPLRIAQARGIAPTLENVGPTLDKLFDKVFTHLGAQGATPVLPAITVYYDMEYGERDVDVGASLVFEGKVTDGEQVKVVELPAVESMASVIHRGSFSGLGQGYNAMLKWIETNGYHISGPNRELNLEYVRGGDESKFVTELQMPIERN